MAIFGVGANYDGKEDVSDFFIRESIIGTDYDVVIAPDIHQFFRSLKVGDIVYIKTFHPINKDTVIKSIGLVNDAQILDKSPSDGYILRVGRKVLWLTTDKIVAPALDKWKNNVRQNVIYEEFHPEIQKIILEKLHQLSN